MTLTSGTLALGKNDAISDGTSLTFDGGVLDLNGQSETVGAVMLFKGSILNGSLNSNSYIIESGTVTATLAGPSALTKNTARQATTGGVNTSNITVNADQLTVTSINSGTLTIGAGATLTIAPITGGLLANGTLMPLATRALHPILQKTVAQTIAADTAAPYLTADTALIAAGPLAASTVLAAPTPALSEVASALASLGSLSKAVVFDAVATSTAIIANKALPVRLVESTVARLIDTDINRLLP